MEDREYLRLLLERMPCGPCTYEEWIDVGIAIKNAGGNISEWESWSREDGRRFKEGECEAKWRSFRGAVRPIGVGTVVEIARRMGVEPPPTDREDRPLDWVSKIVDKAPAIATGWTEEIPENKDSPAKQLRDYLKTMYTDEEHVGYVTEVYGEGSPTRGAYSQTAGELIAKLSRTTKINNVIGDWQDEWGAWIRINPLDGEGASDKNVTAYRHALVECDNIPVEKQYSIIKQLQLPVTAIVYSGGKSIHALVKVEAKDATEYIQRVEFLYEVCEKNGLTIDRQNRNPSRLSRMPGVTRNGKMQTLLALHQGKENWQEWIDYIAEKEDNLPAITCLDEYFNNPPPLAPELINNILRTGHKMLLAGPSKAGKSFLLLRLAASIAEGQKWLGFSCRQGRVLYVNLEIDNATIFHRMRDVYAAAHIEPKNVKNIDIWNLRGKACPMDQLAPKLIHRALRKKEEGNGYEAIIIDPIYKVITGDENTASEMAQFCNQFDKVCADLGTALIYCHHHSKGDQGQKRASDRASGSGVFARDPDALIDMVEVGVDDMARELIAGDCRRVVLADEITRRCGADWLKEGVDPQNDEFYKLYEIGLSKIGASACQECTREAEQMAKTATGWRIESVLREFASFRPFRCIFRYPCHYVDEKGYLAKARAAGEEDTKHKS